MVKRKKPSVSQRIKKQKSRVDRKVKKAKKKVSRQVKKTKKKVVRRAKKAKRLLKKKTKVAKRKFKRLKKKTTKKVTRKLKSIRRARAKAVRRSFRRSGIADDGEELNFTRDASQSSATTAYIKEFPEAKGASRPGEPPKMRTGTGRSAIKAQLVTSKRRRHDVSARVYVDKRRAAYMAMWEYRKDGQGRPFLKPSLENNRAMLGGMIGTTLRRKLRKGKRRKARVS